MGCCGDQGTLLISIFFPPASTFPYQRIDFFSAFPVAQVPSPTEFILILNVPLFFKSRILEVCPKTFPEIWLEEGRKSLTLLGLPLQQGLSFLLSVFLLFGDFLIPVGAEFGV
jgi:hypothetical protein